MHGALMIKKTWKKKGRSRKMRPAEKKVADIRDVVMNQPHRRDLPVVIEVDFKTGRRTTKDGRLDQRAENPLGLLNLRGIISKEQYLAAQRYARDVRLYQEVIGAPPPNAPSLDPVGRIGGEPRPIGLVDRVERTQRYNDAVEAVMLVGQKAAKAVARMAVYGQELPEGTSIEGHLKPGLTALVSHYGLKAGK